MCATVLTILLLLFAVYAHTGFGQVLQSVDAGVLTCPKTLCVHWMERNGHWIFTKTHFLSVHWILMSAAVYWLIECLMHVHTVSPMNTLVQLSFR